MKKVGYNHTRSNHKHHMLKMAVKTVLVILVLMGSIGVFKYFSQYKGPIPEKIHERLSFDVYLPDPVKAQIDQNTFTFNEEEQALTFAVTSNGVRILITQQPEPAIFKEGEVYQHLLNKMRQYDEVKTTIGTATLTSPEELKGGQTAVINTKGILLFAKPDKNLTSEEWRNFFNSLRKSS